MKSIELLPITETVAIEDSTPAPEIDDQSDGSFSFFDLIMSDDGIDDLFETDGGDGADIDDGDDDGADAGDDSDDYKDKDKNEYNEDTGAENQPMADFLLTLRNESNQIVQTYSSTVNANTFAAGLALTTNVFSSLSSVIGSCGVVCLHGLSSASALSSSGLSAASGNLTSLASFSKPSFNIDSNGNFHLDGSVRDIATLSGISEKNLRNGSFTMDELLIPFYDSFLQSFFGDSVSSLLGFQLMTSVLDSIFDLFPNQSTQTIAA